MPAAGGGEGGIGLALGLVEGVGGAMTGIGVGPVEAPLVDPHAVSTVINAAALINRLTQIATGWRYAIGMSYVDLRLQ